MRQLIEQKKRPMRQCHSTKYVNGELLYYLGKKYTLLIQNDGPRERIFLKSDTITVFCRRPHSPLYIGQQMNNWYKQAAHNIFHEQLQLCSQCFVPDNPPTLAIRQMKSRLGSYSPKTHRVCLNRNLIMLEKKHIDYVIIHELCHITHLSHDKQFYALLRRYLPEWKRLETELESALLRMGQ